MFARPRTFSRLVGVSCLLCAPHAVAAQPVSPSLSQPASTSRPPDEYLAGCLRLIRQKDYAEARRLLEPVVADHADWHLPQLYLGLTYHKEDRFELACKFFERALELKPDYHPTRMFYGWALYYLGQMPEAREMFESYLRINPSYADAVFAIGLIELDGGDLAAARQRFERAIALSEPRGDTETEAKSRARLADVMAREGRLLDARRELQRSIALNPNNYEVYFKLSRVLQRMGDDPGAERARQMHDAVRRRMRPDAQPVREQLR